MHLPVLSAVVPGTWAEGEPASKCSMEQHSREQVIATAQASVCEGAAGHVPCIWMHVSFI
jgi:hypothetical protein